MEQQVLGGRYLLKDKVGTGGMATVYRAQDQVLNRTVAVKIMLPQYAADATFAARFKQEAQAAAGLSSPYIVGVYDWGKDGDTYYIVMEYLRGTDLKSGIRSHGALDPKKVAQIGSQICAALSVAHKHEIIHRDIKPQNIMVLPDGNIKVMDFGIARAKNSHLTQDNNVLGTAHYVSPEQTRGQELGPTSDLYSLGVVMYECATGQVPFDGDDAISVALKQVNELPVPPSQINPNVDPTLERIILKCMEKDPANRYQTADELRQVLNAYLSGHQVDVPEPTRVIGGAGTTETRVMSDQTQAMVRPAIESTRSSARGVSGGAASLNGTGSYEAKKRGGKGKVVAAIVGVIVVIAAIVVVASGMLGGNAAAETVEVPNIVNQDQATAEQMLEAAGLEVGNTDRNYDDTIAEGKIIDQLPSAGQPVDKGSTVDITVSRGPQPVEHVNVPTITNMTEEQALAALAEAGLTGQQHQEENDAAKGTVYQQSPAAGDQVEAGGTVEYWVSTGPSTVAVPDVTGDTETEATNRLSDAGFGVSGNTSSYSDTVPQGCVISYSPAGQQAPGTQISLVLSLGPEPDPVGDVPNVTGDAQADAESALANAGFEVKVSEQASSTVPKGQVISYSPNGTQNLGTTVTIVVSTGPASTGNSSTSGNGGDNSSGNGTTSTGGGTTSNGTGGGTSTSSNGGANSGGTTNSSTDKNA